VLDLLVDLALGDGRSADLHPGTRHLVGDALGGVLAGVVVGRPERRREVGQPAVAGDSAARHPRDVGVATQLGRQRTDVGAALGEHDHADVAVAGVVEPVVRDHALGVGVVGAVGVEPVGHPRAERAGHDEEDRREQERATRVAVGQACEALDHESRSASRAHQSIIHSLDSMP
jgi:hypothetical protein